ncbi:MAG: pyridoxamine 5'-phosphate oxidase family protein, partial [Kutzneria sp.]|nr:pyridoxamine 5'-phosphate oxidase family protein [Kutzneria sp.]
MSRQPLSPTARSTLNRAKDRAVIDRSELDAVLDEGLICHLGVIVDGAPVVLPTGYGRDGDTLYLHGSTGARSLRSKDDVCVTVTLVDGVVYARSVFHHSLNYRSAVVHGRLRGIDDPAEKLRALRVVVEHMAPGSWEHARQPTKRELAATAVLALDLTEASVKVRRGGPNDDAEDIAADTAWAGVLAIVCQWGTAESHASLPVPAHV